MSSANKFDVWEFKIMMIIKWFTATDFSDRGSNSSFSPTGISWFSMWNSLRLSSLSKPSTTVIEFCPKYLKKTNRWAGIEAKSVKLDLNYVITSYITYSFDSLFRLSSPSIFVILLFCRYKCVRFTAKPRFSILLMELS
jgi:hypothetical protein